MQGDAGLRILAPWIAAQHRMQIELAIHSNGFGVVRSDVGEMGAQADLQCHSFADDYPLLAQASDMEAIFLCARAEVVESKNVLEVVPIV